MIKENSSRNRLYDEISFFAIIFIMIFDYFHDLDNDNDHIKILNYYFKGFYRFLPFPVGANKVIDLDLCLY